jgi:hypothetical protein
MGKLRTEVAMLKRRDLSLLRDSVLWPVAPHTCALVLLPAFLLVGSATVSVAQQQDSTSGAFVPESYFSLSASAFFGDSAIRKSYGTLWGLRGTVTRELSPDLRFEAGVGFASGESEISSGGDKIGRGSLVQLSLQGTMHYVRTWNSGAGATYGRAGLILAQMREKIRTTIENTEGSGQGVGLIVGGGFLFKESTGEWYIEANYESVASENLDVEGLELVLGTRRALRRR